MATAVAISRCAVSSLGELKAYYESVDAAGGRVIRSGQLWDAARGAFEQANQPGALGRHISAEMEIDGVAYVVFAVRRTADLATVVTVDHRALPDDSPCDSD